MSNFAKLVDDKKINLLGIGEIQKEELIEIGLKVGLEKVKKKSLEMLRREIEHLGKLALAGQVFQILKGGNFNQKIPRVHVTATSARGDRLGVLLMYTASMLLK